MREALQGQGRDSWLARKMYLHEARMNTLKINLSYSPSVVALDISSLRSLQVTVSCVACWLTRAVAGVRVCHRQGCSRLCRAQAGTWRRGSRMPPRMP